jgi:hypothetical protein
MQSILIILGFAYLGYIIGIIHAVLTAQRELKTELKTEKQLADMCAKAVSDLSSIVDGYTEEIKKIKEILEELDPSKNDKN